jgi:hypothetical protein
MLPANRVALSEGFSASEMNLKSLVSSRNEGSSSSSGSLVAEYDEISSFLKEVFGDEGVAEIWAQSEVPEVSLSRKSRGPPDGLLSPFGTFAEGRGGVFAGDEGTDVDKKSKSHGSVPAAVDLAKFDFCVSASPSRDGCCPNEMSPRSLKASGLVSRLWFLLEAVVDPRGLAGDAGDKAARDANPSSLRPSAATFVMLRRSDALAKASRSHISAPFVVPLTDQDADPVSEGRKAFRGLLCTAGVKPESKSPKASFFVLSPAGRPALFICGVG